MKTAVAVSMLSLLLSCNDARVHYEGGVRSEYDMVAEEALSGEEHSPRIELAKMPDPVVQTERKLIKRGYLNISVESSDSTKKDIVGICRKYHAYVTSETQNNRAEHIEYNQVIRVPAIHFDEFVGQVERLGIEVNHKNIETSDVTEEFIDKEARIKTKKELENRYREILKQAKDVSDILSIEAQLNHVRSDIESMQGRLNYLRGQVEHSTLTLVFTEPTGSELTFGSETVAAFGNGWVMLLGFVIGLINLWPFILIATGICYFLYRKLPAHGLRGARGV